MHSPDEYDAPPDWMIDDLNYIRTARFLGVNLWEMDKVPQAWIEKAKFYAEAEERAGKIKKTSIEE